MENKAIHSGKTPVLVYQMGKVGSTSVYRSLLACNLPDAVFHVHFLSQQGIEEAESYFRQRLGENNPAHLFLSRKLKLLLDRRAGDIRWKIVTMVRDPVAREISDLFENMKLVLPETGQMSPPQAQNRICEYMRHKFECLDQAGDYASNWFDKELKTVFGIDLYAHSFDAKAGYSIYHAPIADILVIRLEDMDRCISAAMNDFLGIDRFPLIRGNVRKPTLYDDVKRNLRFPGEVLDRIYGTRMATHFYTGEERRRFKQRWAVPRIFSLPCRQAANSGRILIVHPEGNVNNNPNLSGIIQILCERGYRIDYAGLKKDYPQVPPCHGVRMLVADAGRRTELDGFVLLETDVLRSAWAVKSLIRDRLAAYDLVIGVDRGIIEANLIALHQQIPCGLISYEILFLKEAGPAIKQVEIASCQRLSFALCQDAVRAKHLVRENHLQTDRMIIMPMGARGTHPPGTSDYLHKTLDIPPDKKIALVIGSLARWTMTDYIIHCLKQWPDDWVVVLHNRYGLDAETRGYLSRFGNVRNLYFSLKPETTHESMKRIIQSAQVGLALYRTVANNLYQGDNLRYIGMASGKIATYLQYGLPVVVNDIGIMSDLVRNHQLGATIDTREIFIPGFKEEKLYSMRENCHRFYAQRLDLNHTVEPLVQRIETLIKGAAINQHTGSRMPSISHGSGHQGIEAKTAMMLGNQQW